MGNRRGEALALRVKKIDFKNKTILIDESITFEILPEERKKGLTYKTTDRKNPRALVESIPDTLCEMLQEYITTLNLSSESNPKRRRIFMAALIIKMKHQKQFKGLTIRR